MAQNNVSSAKPSDSAWTAPSGANRPGFVSVGVYPEGDGKLCCVGGGLRTPPTL